MLISSASTALVMYSGDASTHSISQIIKVNVYITPPISVYALAGLKLAWRHFLSPKADSTAPSKEFVEDSLFYRPTISGKAYIEDTLISSI
jgi:hypothetical protein